MDSSDRQNSFTLLRLVFALAVVVAHSFAIGGFGADPLARMSYSALHMGLLAVNCFFVLSGFLIAGSAVRQPLWRFGLNRAARLLPGYWVMHVLCALVLAPTVLMSRHAEVDDYFVSLMIGPNSALSYLGQNAVPVIQQYQISHLFPVMPCTQTLNGSLWSLGPEIICYLYLALLALCGGLRYRVVSLVIFALVYALQVVGAFEPATISAIAPFAAKAGVTGLQHPMYLSLYIAFAAGVVFFQFRDLIRWKAGLFAAALAALILGDVVGYFNLIWPLALPYAVLYLAHRPSFARVERWGDFSYGIYIYAFPIQQLLALAALQRFGVTTFLAASCILSIIAGMASWRWIEAPALRWARSTRRRIVANVPPLSDTARREVELVA